MNYFGLFNIIASLCNRAGSGISWQELLVMGRLVYDQMQSSSQGLSEGVSLSLGVCVSDSLPSAASKLDPFPPSLSWPALAAGRTDRQTVLALAFSELPSANAPYLFIFPLFCGTCNLVCYFLLCVHKVWHMNRYLLSFICPTVTNHSAQNNLL